MSRPLRIEYAEALYHITSRGNARENIYLTDDDRLNFLKILKQVCETYNWICHAYCLMDNHYHLLIETPEGNLSRGMRQLNGVYTQTFNSSNNRVGHVFQGRFKGILVEKQSYLLELCRYIVLNPVRAKMVRDVKKWAWSSYRETAGLIEVKDPIVSIEWLLSNFAKRKKVAQYKYIKFVSEGKNIPQIWNDLKQQIFLGNESFVKDLLESKMELDKDISEIPSSQKRPQAKSLQYYEKTTQSRNEAILKAWESGGYTQKAIADNYKIHYSYVNKIIKKMKAVSG